MRRVFLTATAAIAIAIGVGGPAAHASIILSLDGDAPTAVAGGYDYTYDVSLSVDEQLDPSVQTNFFTLYDFGAATLVSNDLVNSADWTFILNANQSTPAEGETPNNNPTIADVRAIYDGPVVTGTGLGAGQDNLGTFTLFTTYTGPFAVMDNDQDAQLAKYAPSTPTNDTPTSNLAAVAMPTAATPTVPEPTTLALLGSGLIGLGVVRRKRGR